MKEEISGAPTRLCLAVALCTMATLLLELSLTRIFSVVLFYHFAFVAISVALFGLGAGGVLSYYVDKDSAKESIWSRLGRFCTINGLVVFTALYVVLNRPLYFDVSWTNALRLGFVYVVCAFPFLISGMVISMAISKTVRSVSRVYFYDLMGAALGCILLVPFLDWVGGPGTVMLSGVFFSAAGGVWYSMDAESGRKVRKSYAIAACLGLLVFINHSAPFMDVKYAKGMLIEGEEYSQWNSFSRISVGPSADTGEPLILIDSDAGTEISQCDPATMTAEQREKLLSIGPGLPYAVRPNAKTLVIGAGGGPDVCRALVTGSKSVTAVEINPIIANNVMRDRYAETSKGLYLRPEVNVVVEDGRSYIRRADETFDVIQMTLVDSWASTAAGAFALAENHLYTTEAFTDYLSHLTDNGLVAITRWEFAEPRESLRILSLGLASLRALGVSNPEQHFIIAREDIEEIGEWGAKDTVMIKRAPFTGGEIAAARETIERSGLNIVYMPGETTENAFTDLLRSSDPIAFAEAYPYDITPVTDDRPFFFYTWRTSRIWDMVRSPFTADTKINLGVMLLFVSLGLGIFGMAVILLLPGLVLGQRVPRERPMWIHLLYFVSIGLGFILVEIAFVQRIALYLGQPTYALTVVIFSLLLSSGIGSYLSRDVVGGDDRRLLGVLVGIALLAGALIMVTPAILDASLSLPLAAKLLLVVTLLAPIGFLMGMPFPSGLLRLEKQYSQAVCWAWAVNAAASVLGSVSAIFLAIHVGLAQTVLIGGVCYFGAFAAVLMTANSKAAKRVATATLASVSLSK